MRGRIAAGVALVLLVGLVAWRSCGADGSGRCYNAPLLGVNVALPQGLSDVVVEPCDDPHDFESYHEGEFPPGAGPEDKAASARVHRDCIAAAGSFLGGDAAVARVGVWVLTSKSESESGGEGGRRYVCLLGEAADSDGKVKQHARSLRGGLRGGRPLAVTCGYETGSSLQTVERVSYVDCGQRHSVEFVGLHPLPAGDEFPGYDVVLAIAKQQCGQRAAAYVGLTVGELADSAELSYFWLAPDSDRWMWGERAVACYVVERDRQLQLQGSVKGLGRRPLPK